MLSNPFARMLSVDLFLYPTIIKVASKTMQQLKQDARTIIANIDNHYCTYLRTFSVNLASLEVCNARFSEKQVSRIDDNFCYYSYGRRFPLGRHSLRAPKGASCMVRKTFSGDVSGEIGESLFTYFLVTEMGIDSSEISHLRPGKKAPFLVPDFLVLDSGFSLAPLVGRNSYPRPLLAEVKGFTGKLEPNRIKHALEQLKPLVRRSYIGIVFLAARNQNRRCYDAYVLRVEK
jgi:hypothetical protein